MATRAVAGAAVAGGGLLLAASAASAATTPGFNFAPAPATYTCSLAGLGQGFPTFTLPATMLAPTQVTAGTTVTVKLVTTATTLPTAVTSFFNQNATGFGFNGTAGFTGQWTGNTALTGTSTFGAGQFTTFPSITALGTFNPTGTAGQFFANAPQTITITVSTAPTATTTMAPITCTLASPVSMALQLLAGGTTGIGTTPVTGTTAGAQAYTCTIANASPFTMNMNFFGFNNRFTMNHMTRFGMMGTFGNQFANAQFMNGNGSFGFSGFSNGTVPLTGGFNNGNFTLTGNWMPAHNGRFQFMAPRNFRFQMMRNQAPVVVVCTAATTPATTMAQVGDTGAAAGGQGNVATGEGSPVANAGAPNTGAGGSLHSSSNTALMAGGGAALLAGIGIILFAMKRRGLFGL